MKHATKSRDLLYNNGIYRNPLQRYRAILTMVTRATLARSRPGEHCSRYLVSADHYLNHWWLVYWRINASLGHNELITSRRRVYMFHGVFDTCCDRKRVNSMCDHFMRKYYGHGNGQDWVDGRITGVHTYPWPTCGPQTVHTRYTIVRLIRIEIVSATLSYISRAWLEVDLSLWIPHSISLLIIVHVASIPVS